MQKSEDGQGATLHSEGKMAAAKTFSLVKRNGIFYEIDGLERDRLIQRKTAQNEILECIKAIPGIKQKQIVQKLKKHKQNVSRDIIKLLKNDYVSGNPNDGYFAVTPYDYPDDTDD